MNYCDKISYTVYTTEKSDFDKMVDRLLAQLPADKRIFRLVFFGAPAHNGQYMERRALLRAKVRAYCGADEPVVTYVAQPPLNGGLVLEAHLYAPETDEYITYKRMGDFPYVVLENSDGRFLFAGGFQGNVAGSGIGEQAEDVFRLVTGVLDREKFPLNSIIRQWNYIEQITRYDGEDQHYQLFNNARSACYARTVWDNGYPAATGIGADLGGILVDLDAAVFSDNACFATPIDNKLQVAAHAYSEQVLEAAHSKKTTPKFERAKSMTFGNRKLIYVSGTAAIRGEDSLVGVGLERQFRITMENIAELTGNAELKMLRVYLKDEALYEECERLLTAYGPHIPVSYMWADVCRDELLIEIEGIAVA